MDAIKNTESHEKNLAYLGHRVYACRMCDSDNLYPFLDLGFTPPADAILTKEELKDPEIRFPLTIQQCQDCGLTQVGYAVNPELMYGEKYKYEASTTETGKRHFFSMADSITQRFNLGGGSLVVDIGSNVGVLLEGFQRNGMNVLGIDPAPKICKIANERGIETWQYFLSTDVAKEVVAKKGRAKVITGTNVWAHIDDKRGLIESLDEVLDKEGVFIFEVPYLVDLLGNMEYDTMYLEHLEYSSVQPLANFFGRHGMSVFDVERHPIHGKSIRIFVSRKGSRPVSEHVGELQELEDEHGIYQKRTLDGFAAEVAEHKNGLVRLLGSLKNEGKKIVGISAPAKGNTILNYCKIGPEILDYMAEKASIKHGCYTPGMHIPIVDEARILKDQPDYGVVFAWNFANEIISNNSEFSGRGGRFIIPVPKPKIV